MCIRDRGCGGLAIAITVTALGVKARRAEIPETKKFGYGSALWAGVQISAVASFLSAIFIYVYHAYINPGLSELMLQDTMDKLQAKGMGGPQLDQVEKITRMMMGPAPQAISALIAGFIVGFIISLIVAAVLKRPEPEGPPPV